MIKIVIKNPQLIYDYYQDIADNLFEAIENKQKNNSKITKELSIMFPSIEEVRKVLIGNCDELNKFINQYISFNVNEEQHNEFTELFNYDSFAAKYRTCILAKLDLKICPYCDISPIFVYKDNDKDKIMATCDHFYLKSKYPILAFSVYNFVPACYHCNSNLKAKTDFFQIKHIYPYEEEFGNAATFIIEEKDGSFFSGGENFTIEIKVNDSPLKGKILNSIKTFKIVEKYQNFKDDAKGILKIINRYSKSQLKEYSKMELFVNNNGIIKEFDMIFLETSLHKKFTYDIVKYICTA